MSQQRVCAYCGRVTWETNLHLCDPGTAQFKLTERLAQVERQRDEWKATAMDADKMGGVTRTERDNYRTERNAALADMKIARHALGEALAKAEEWEKEARRMDAEIGFGHERENALREKAEAAESKRDYWHGQWFELSQEASQFVDLRARIEALANGWYSEPALQQQLRAILTPPKAETVAELLSRLEAAYGPIPDIAKLRKLLEEQGK